MRSLIPLLLASLLTLAGPAFAFPVAVSHVDLPSCDPLVVPQELHELGDPFAGGFPLDEAIDSTALSVPLPPIACVATAALNVLVTMTNLSPFDYDNVWYVADPETTIANVDGLVNGEEAFRIDAVGLNAPLIGESGFFPGIFESGETWEFLIDGYFNTFALPASNFFSLGLVGGLSGGDTLSSGSIIATRQSLPEPAAFVLAGLALGALALRRARG